jgi:hypothetical protein
VYAELYTLFERARGGYAGRFATLTESRDFSHSPEPDLRDLATALEHVSASERSELNGHLDKGNLQTARKLANVLWERDALRRSNKAFGDFKNSWVLNSLYISPEVSLVIIEGVQLFASLSVYGSELIEDPNATVGKRRELAEKVQKLDELSAKLRAVMRDEMYPQAN